MSRSLRLILACSALACAATPALAQISFSTAIDLALKNSPKVHIAEADVAKAKASFEQVRDAYIPSVEGGSGLGPPSYGFPLGTPSIFNLTAHSLVFSYSQRDYLRAAHAALDAAKLALSDARQGVMEDTATTYVGVGHDLQRQAAINEESGYASRLVTIVQERLDAGQDTPISLTSARLTAAQIRLARLRAEDETATDLAHLALLIGLPSQGLMIEISSVPPLSTPDLDLPLAPATSNPAVASAYASAHAKRETAFGEAKYLWRPQIIFDGQYSRFAEFNNIQDYYRNFQHNNAAVGVQITVPIYDKGHGAKAREAAADAAHAEHEADLMRDQFFESRIKIQHTATELSARAEVASLDQQLAHQQLDTMLVQLSAGNGNSSAPQMTPKDEQTARIAEREKFLSMLDATFQLQQAQINLLRQTGGLEAWIQSAVQIQPVTPKP